MAKEQIYRPAQSRGIILGLGVMWILLALLVLALQFILPPRIEIEWETETEIDTAGFNIYRSDSAEGEFVRINDQIIPSQPDAVSGAAYLFVDENVERGKVYYYRLEDIEYDNTTQQHEILTGEVAGLNWWTIPLTLFSGTVGIFMLVSGLRPR